MAEIVEHCKLPSKKRGSLISPIHSSIKNLAFMKLENRFANICPVVKSWMIPPFSMDDHTTIPWFSDLLGSSRDVSCGDHFLHCLESLVLTKKELTLLATFLDGLDGLSFWLLCILIGSMATYPLHACCTLLCTHFFSPPFLPKTPILVDESPHLQIERAQIQFSHPFWVIYTYLAHFVPQF